MSGAHKDVDLAIVGGGSAGFAAAIHARRKGLRVVMVESGEIGGTCVNVGCIPSKALLVAAEERHTAAAARYPGITTSAGGVDFRALVRAKDAIVADLREDKYLSLAEEYGWQIVAGHAQFAPGPVLTVDGQPIEAQHYLIATGSTAFIPRITGLRDVPYLTSTSVMELAGVPESVVVIGGNYIGLELGQMLARLGSRVTVVEALDRIAPHEEPEISQTLADVLREEGIVIHVGAKVTSVAADGRGVVVTATVDGADRQLPASHVVVATGRQPNTSGLRLEAVGVRVGRRGEVLTDDHLRASNDRIWAAGDVTGHPQFVYVAGAHGVIAVENAFENAGRRVEYRTLPRVTFTTPNIATVGLTDHEAQEAGLECECRSVPLTVVPRALVNRDTRGLVKIVAERQTGIVRGVHMLADNAGDSILAGVYAIECHMTVQQLANIWCPYLTMSEGIKLAAQAFMMDVTKLSCCGA
jgi:mercuric reductase